MKTRVEAMRDLRKVPDKKITLQRPNGASDHQGGSNTGFVDVESVYAEKRNPRMAQSEMAGDFVSEITWEFRIWRRTDVRRGWQVLLGKQKFKVLHVYEPNREKTALVCEEISR